MDKGNNAAKLLNAISKKSVSHHTLGARDFSSAVSGFCQVFIVTQGSLITEVFKIGAIVTFGYAAACFVPSSEDMKQKCSNKQSGNTN